MRLIWSRDAETDKDAIWHFLAKRSVHYAARVERRIEERVANLPRLPRQGRALSGGPIRRLSVPDMQYVIDYRIEDDAIRILRVRGTAQDYE